MVLILKNYYYFIIIKIKLISHLSIRENEKICYPKQTVTILITETTKHTENIETIKSTEYIETIKPTEFIETTKLTEYIETIKPTEYIETTKPTVYIETTKLTEYIETTKPTEYIETTKPTETTKPSPIEYCEVILKEACFKKNNYY